ncbi:hypothetical protein FRC12_005231 [Ceratobasidium sp. 428]|nr:hypothetical protein FRC12_005231 [Ceratobasidium sp. 428]
MSHPTYSRLPADDSGTSTLGSTSVRTLSRQASDSGLVPRTPHSRSGGQTFRESATIDFDSGDLNDGINESYALAQQSQLAPLLASSASASFGDDIHLQAHHPARVGSRSHRRRSHTWGLKELASYLPLILGSLVAVVVCILIIISINWPDALQSLVSEPPQPDHAPDSSSIQNSTVVSGSVPATNETVSHDHTATVISYSGYSTFPLTPEQYRTECWKQQANAHHGGYWYKPPGGAADVIHSTTKENVCSSTITYMFDGDRGLMADLALIAQLAGLAREQGRTFLIDDRLWTRGNWTTHFKDIRQTQPGPEPGCLPPPPEELVACPRLAKHWVVTPFTAKFHFGHDFFEEFEDPYSRSTARLKPIFDRAFASFETFIILSEKNAQLVREARSELRRRIQATTDSAAVTNYMGMHIRRGDRQAMSWEFIMPGTDRYVPLQNYIDAVQKTWAEQGPPGVPHVYVASDDPVILDEFINRTSAHVYSLRQWGVDGGRVGDGSVSPVSEELAELASPSAYNQSEWRSRPEVQRIRLTRGMIVEMALISELWDDERDGGNDLELLATACTLTSNICKMAAVGLGWARALGTEAKAWVELDNRGNIEPEWEAIETI